MEIKNYICPKCQNRSYEVDEFAVTIATKSFINFNESVKVFL